MFIYTLISQLFVVFWLAAAVKLVRKEIILSRRNRSCATFIDLFHQQKQAA